MQKTSRFSAILLAIALAPACRGSEPAKEDASPQASKTSGVEPKQSVFLARCFESCMRERQARAMAIQVIEDSCHRDCQKKWDLPLLRSEKEINAKVGSEVRILGRLKLGEPPVLELQDGTQTALSSGVGLDGTALAGLDARWVVAVGNVENTSPRQIGVVSVVTPVE